MTYGKHFSREVRVSILWDFLKEQTSFRLRRTS